MLRARESGYKLVLVFADALAFLVAYITAFYMRQDLLSAWFVKVMEPFPVYAVVLPYVLIVWLVLVGAVGGYEIRLRGASEFVVLLKAAVVAALVLLAVAALYRRFEFSRGFVAFFFALLVPVTLLFRAFLRKIRRLIFKKTASVIRVALVGMNELAASLATELKSLPLGYRVIGYIDEVGGTLEGCPGGDAGASFGAAMPCGVGEGGAVAANLPGGVTVSKAPASSQSVPEPPSVSSTAVSAMTDQPPAPPTAKGSNSVGAAAATARWAKFARLGDISSLQDIVARHELDELWIVMPGAPRAQLAALVDECLRLRVSWRMVPDVFEMMFDWVKLDTIAGIPLIGMRVSNIVGLNAVVKRIFDIVFGALFLAIAAIPMIIIALLIKLTSPGPVLFLQKRIGYKGKPFTFLKFRSMVESASPAAHKSFIKAWIAGSNEGTSRTDDGRTVYKMLNDERITPVGRFLRKFSLDELPQLFNVLKGDMSLVGPRPCVPYELAEYKEWHKLRLEARPGITGLWQTSGRNLLSFDEMVRLDIFYVENWSLALDLKIILKTIGVVLLGRAY